MADFDDLPENRKPNPLPCGCAIMAVAGINLEGTKTEFRDRHIRFCPMHEAAGDLLAACESALVALAANDGYKGVGADACKTLRASIAKAREPKSEKTVSI